ncbi:MAG: YceI family protein [candidate division KSB1 bacterium]|nr:YceI family protein [candidate division KSB1 bacterium]
MKKILYGLTTAWLINIGLNAAEWTVDASHTEIGFSVKHMVISKVNGKFTDYSGEILLDPQNIEGARVKGVIKAASINTGNEARDNHLRSADFFDVEKYPEILFETVSIKKEGGRYKVVGNLTMHGVTKPIELFATLAGPIKDPWGNERLGVEATGVLNRTEWGLTWDKVMETGGLVVGHEVELKLAAELVRK